MFNHVIYDSVFVVKRSRLAASIFNNVHICAGLIKIYGPNEQSWVVTNTHHHHHHHHHHYHHHNYLLHSYLQSSLRHVYLSYRCRTLHYHMVLPNL
ncbi:uncharacterized protein VTP21DRAFT_4621 [Calcarisporiella thermophila]|uniref:uncharacterized protein n=1 Tax=Calcarisporiella thermophila TaxID=911321 RepID=UPI00374341F8